jgi:2,5-diketo-D-gluconate reductase B
MPVPVFESPLTRMPRLGLGTWPMTGAACQASVEAALGMGYRHIDTAEMYDNEVPVGAAIRASGLPREAIYLTTKIWHYVHQQSTPQTPAAFRAAFDRGLARLGLDYVDLLMIHWPAPQMDLPMVLEGLARLRDAGLARAVGVANFPRGLLLRAIEARIVPLAAAQVEHHVYLSQQRLLEVTRAHDMVLTSYAPVVKGKVLEDPVIQRIAAKHGATPGQVALAWLLAIPGVAAIPKAASAARQAENLAASDLMLDAADLTALAALPKDRRTVDPGFAPDWAA